MASILKFDPEAQRTRLRVRPPVLQMCEIVILPGVRYERWESSEPLKPTPRPKRRRQRRKRVN